MGDFKTYSPDLVVVTVGPYIISGYANDTFVTVERDEATFTKYTGSLGDVARSRNLNKGGKITLTLMAVAPINDGLSSMAATDEDLNAGFFPVQIRDNSGTLIINSEIAWIEKWPTIERGKESGTVEWVIDCADITMDAGGGVLPL